MPKAQSFDLPAYGPQTPRYGARDSGSEAASSRSHSPTQYVFDEKPRLKASKSTTTLARVKNAFEERYGRSPSLPPGSPHMQSYYTPFDLGLRRPLARKFDPQRQLLRLLAKGFSRWIVSILIITATITTLWVYSHEMVLSGNQKKGFNAITTALLLLLNINIQSSFKQAAIFMRWKIVASRRQTLRELDLTLGLDSLARVARLAWVSRRKPLFLLGLLGWLLLSLSIFALVAAVQLTYSMEDSTGALFGEGEVRITRMDHYFPKNNTEVIPSLGHEQAMAHTYGYISSCYIQGNASDFLEMQMTGSMEVGSYMTFNMIDHWRYMFYESNPTARGTFYTNRTVNVTWLCSAYDVVEGGDGRSNNIVYDDAGQRLPFFVGETGPAATTYITETEEVCGPRCARVWAFQTAISERDVLPSLYDCNITVGDVANAQLEEHVLPDLQARLAAGAIGLEGFQHENTTRQWVRYHDKDWWANGYGNSPDDMGWLIGQFAIGVIGVAQELNAYTFVQGQLAIMGSKLTVQWKNFLLILFGLGSVQLIVFLFSVLVANSVVVKDDSRLAIARLLRPIVERLGSAGCVLDGDDISKTLRSEVVYGVRTAGGWHHLDLGPDIQPVGLFGSFPAGWYDGEVIPEEEEEEEDQEQLKHVNDRQPSSSISDTTPSSASTSFSRPSPFEAHLRTRNRGKGRSKLD